MRWDIIRELILVAFAGVCVLSCRGEELSMPASQASLRIRTGVYFGECIGYCREEMIITPSGIKYVKSAFPSDPSQPDIIIEQPIDVRDWNELMQSLDLAAFRRLPRRIGDPDAADRGGEWVEISEAAQTKRVDFVLDAKVREISPFLEKLRALRKEISAHAP